MDEGRDIRSIEEQEWAATELRNALRSIEWDLEDLDDTVQGPYSIVWRESTFLFCPENTERSLKLNPAAAPTVCFLGQRAGWTGHCTEQKQEVILTKLYNYS